MNEKILIVDDEPAVLTSLERNLRKEFDLDTAASAEEALHAIFVHGPYAVIVSDLKLAGMSGIELLAKIKDNWPETVRILLTGNFDIHAALDAVNQGYVFRFLTKPCPLDLLAATLRAGLAQYRLGAAEREVLEETLLGALTVLTEVMSVLHPVAFGRALSLRQRVRQLAEDLSSADRWQVEAAALLSQIGLISVPADTVEKLYLGEPLSDEEEVALAAHPVVGHSLLDHIPGLKCIAAMVGGQQKAYREVALEAPPNEVLAAMGAQMLHLGLDYDDLIGTGFDSESALAELGTRRGQYNPRLLMLLAECHARQQEPALCGLNAAMGFTEPPAPGEPASATSPLAAQVWEALHDYVAPVARLHLVGAPMVPAAAPAERLDPHELLEELFRCLDRQFDATYLALVTVEQRVILRESYVLARDAFFYAVGRAFQNNRAAALAIASELERSLRKISDSVQLEHLVPAANLATRLAALADPLDARYGAGQRPPVTLS